jgi:hypothetical protein
LTDSCGCRSSAPAGKLCTDTNQPAQTSTNGKVDVTCRIPSLSEPDCAPDGGTPANSTLQFSSGWTPDGRALDDITIALNSAEKIWPYASPCSFFAAEMMLAGGGDAAMQSFLAQHGFVCKEVGEPATMRVTAVDFTALVLNGKIPVQKLKLVPQIAQLTYLEQVRAEGYPMQQSKQAGRMSG